MLGAVPTQTTVIAERFFDEGGGHAAGDPRAVWRADQQGLGIVALRKRFCVGFNFELQAAATDNGLNIALAEQHSFPLAMCFISCRRIPCSRFWSRRRWILRSLRRAGAGMRTGRWRCCAFRMARKFHRRFSACGRMICWRRYFRMRRLALKTSRASGKIPDHPLVGEVMKDVLTEAMDMEGLKTLLRGMATGEIRVIAVDTPVPSQFSHEILNANPYAYLDDAPLEERRARAVKMRRMLPESVLEEVGGLDQAAIAQVREEAWPDVRDADELHDVLHTLVALPEEFMWGQPPLRQAQGRLSAVQSSEARPALAPITTAGSDWRNHFERLSE